MQIVSVKRKDEPVKYYAMDKRMAVAKMRALAYEMERDRNLVEIQMQPLSDFTQQNEIRRVY